MAHIIEDRVLEQSITAGLGAFTLAGAMLGFRAFASVCAVSDTVWYYIEAIDQLGKPSGAYEYGIGTYSSANTLTRTTVLGSSNGGSPVDFAAGTKLVGIGVMAPGPDAVNGHWRRALGLPPSVKDFNGVGDGSADDTAAFHAAFASLPAGGGEVFVPPGVWDVTGIRIDGASGGLSNITLRGAGPASEIRIHAGDTSNVISALGGTGFRITGLRVRGGLGRGVTGVAAPSRGMWVAGATYTAGQTVEVSSTDTATTTVAAGNLVYQCTTNHTAGATFLADKATKWTASAVANFNTVDISYGTRNNVYLDGVTNSAVDHCEIVDSVYAGVNPGTGPVQAANAGTGSSGITVTENKFLNCTNGIAGGKTSRCNLTDNTMISPVTYGIVIDDPGSANNVVDGNIISGAGSHGIYLYGCDTSSVSDNSVSYCTGVGILIENAAVGNGVNGNSVDHCLHGIRAFNSTISTINSNPCRANTQYGISVELVSQIGLTGNTCEANSYDGIRLTTVSAFSLAGNVCSSNAGEGGIYLTACSNGSVTGGSYLNNNNTGSPSADGAGIRLVNTTGIAIAGVSAFDSRGGGSKTQMYGIRSSGTSDAITLGVNVLDGNATAKFLLSGSNSRVTPDVGMAVAAGSPSGAATHYAPWVQPDGSIFYALGRLGPF